MVVRGEIQPYSAVVGGGGGGSKAFAGTQPCFGKYSRVAVSVTVWVMVWTQVPPEGSWRTSWWLCEVAFERSPRSPRAQRWWLIL